MSCRCQSCKKKYRVDLLVPDEIWEQIKPAGKPQGAGLLCGRCIVDRLEARDRYDAFQLEECGGTNQAESSDGSAE